jgi:DNA-binding LacI/PurR family transcriptional regulator
MKTTMHDIAEKAGVSRATVSYVLNGLHNGSVSAETCRRIQKLAKRMGYVPNRTARTLVTGRSNLIMVWTFSIAETYYATVMGHILPMLRAAGYDAHFCETEDDFAGNHVLRDTDASPAEGIIALDSPECVQAYLGAHGAHRKPLVNMGASAVHETDYVGLDLAAGAKEATRHLIATGRRRIAYLVPASHVVPQDDRHRSYTGAMREAGLAPEYMVVSSPQPGMDRAEARRVVREYVQAKGRPEALFCFSDEGAIGAYRGLRDMGIRIPDDVALVGCNGDVDTEYLDVPISTLVCPVAEMCERAWSFLQQRLANPDLPRQQATLLPKLAIRESSGAEFVGNQ